jgi:hypothetical protein
MASTRLSLVVCMIALPACALVDASEKRVEVKTSPAGAMVNLNGMFVGTSPCSVVVPRSAGGRLEFEVLPPREGTERLWTQRRTIAWKRLPEEGSVLYFDLRLESVRPTQPYEIRDR